MKINVRTAQLADIESLFKCFKSAISEIESSAYSQPQKTAWIKKGGENQDKWLKRIKKDYFILAEVKTEIAGFISVTHAGYVDLLFTNPDFQRNGIANKLYQKAEKYLIGKGVKKLETHASAVSKPFFEKNGFEFQREERFELYQVPISNFLLTKQFN